MNLSSNISTISSTLKTAENYLPEPATNGIGAFKDLWQTALNVGGAILGTALNGSVSQVLNGSGSDLIATQVEMQKEMQVTSMVSNIEKSKHESKMSAIRNIRIS